MIPSKLSSSTNFMNFISKTYSYFKYDLSMKSYSVLAHIHTLKKNNLKTPVYCALSNIKYDSVFNIFTSTYLNDAPKPIEYPPLTSMPLNAEIDEEFGLLGRMKYEKVGLDSEELKEEKRLKEINVKIPRKLKPSAGQYAEMIKNHVAKGDLELAEYVIVKCKQNKDKPTSYMFTLLIKAFAMQGDIKKCYQYYSQMKCRHYKIKGNVYTSLLDACANSPDSEKALNYLQRVKIDMIKTSYPINQVHYNVLIKAYGKHHKLDEANKLLQKMLDNNMKIGISTLCSLMYAANSNTESGLKYVVRIWQLMRKLKVPPTIFSYNLLLRAIRDCHFGNCTVNDLLLKDEECAVIVTDNNRPDLLIYPPVLSNLPLQNIYKTPKLIEAPSSEKSNATDNLPANVNDDSLPESIVNIDLDAVLKQNKLILFGGVEGFLEKMKNDRVEPNIKSVTYLIDLVPPSITAENTIIKHAKNNKIPLDIDFFNMLIKKRALRGAKKEAKAVLDEIHRADLKPNIVTYGVLALSCSTSNESRNLINAMKATGHTMNKYIADSLLTSAFDKRDFPFILELMEKMKYERIRLDEQTFEKMITFQQNMSALVKTKHRSTESERFKVGFAKFNLRFKSWQGDMGRKVVVEHSNKNA
ncbi:pentatricopeptide repeat-containing protein 1, mitochondrial [Phymastichus coffea]|uniref:pentatricopeptide repeat-containing protein 1, mitochondrial n=1 Tax=Phymastichus coffea TaxID=108790 RepID=UPI00273B2ABA|nr:pentatricopeptide repeat-containing protein 1, mitochondrial [Phymastichus coffea]